MPDSQVSVLARRLLDDGAVDTALQAFVAAQLILDAADPLDENGPLPIKTDNAHNNGQRRSPAGG
jgi:hypothetical protein